MDFNNDTFCKRFTELRENSGKSQEELAHILGVTQQTLSRYEKKQRQPSIEFIVKASKFFKVTTDYLLGLSDILTTDVDIQKACTVTGLSEKAIKTLSYIKVTFGLNHLIENVHFIELSHQLEQIYKLYQLSLEDTTALLLETDAFKSSKSCAEFDDEIEKAKYLLTLIGLQTIDRANYFNLCIRNAEDCLRRAFEDWKKQIFDNPM